MLHPSADSSLVTVDVININSEMWDELSRGQDRASTSIRTEEQHSSSPCRTDERHRRDNQYVPITGDGALLPPPFHGLPSENAHDWHSYFKRYISYKRLSPDQTLELFKVLLRGPAATSFAGLEAEAQSDPVQVEKWFNNVYKFPPRQKYKVGHQLFTRKQGPNETVDEYFAAVQAIARQMDDKPSDEIVRYSLIAGLRPNIAGTVMAFAKEDKENNESVSHLLESARLAELMTGNTPDSSTVDSLIAEVKRLSERIDKSTTAQTNTNPSDRRDSFSRSRSPNRQSPQPRNATPEQRYSPAATVASHGHVSRQSRQPQRQFQRNRGQPVNQQSSQRCSRCGLFHTSNEQCPAFNKQCRHCLKFSHFAAMCYSKLKGNPPAQMSNSQ